MDRKKDLDKKKKPGDRSCSSPAKPPPNYMKPIRNHRARKDVFNQPCSCEAGEDTGSSKVASSKPSKKSSPIQRKLKGVVTGRGGGSPAGDKKVCKYSRCSLNPHGHEPAVKHPFLARRLSIRAQKSFRVKVVPVSAPSSSSSSRRRGVWRDEKTEISRHARLRAPSVSKASAPKMIDPSDGADHGGYGSAMKSCSSATSSDERRDRESEFSAAELNIIGDFLDAVGSDGDESYGTVTGSAKWFLDGSSLQELLADLMMDTSLEEETRSSGSRDEAMEWSSKTSKDPGEDPSPELGASVELIGMEAESIIINESEEYPGLDVESPAELDCQLEEGYFPAADDIELLLEEYVSDHGEARDEGGAALAAKEDRGKLAELEARLSMKRSLTEKCFEKLKTIRRFREPDRLPAARERELQRSELTQMAAFDERGAEEWMVDYKLRRLVAELARARKRKVELLVEAFESIKPQIG